MVTAIHPRRSFLQVLMHEWLCGRRTDMWKWILSGTTWWVALCVIAVGMFLHHTTWTMCTRRRLRQPALLSRVSRYHDVSLTAYVRAIESILCSPTVSPSLPSSPRIPRDLCRIMASYSTTSLSDYLVLSVPCAAASGRYACADLLIAPVSLGTLSCAGRLVLEWYQLPRPSFLMRPTPAPAPTRQSYMQVLGVGEDGILRVGHVHESLPEIPEMTRNTSIHSWDPTHAQWVDDHCAFSEWNGAKPWCTFLLPGICHQAVTKTLHFQTWNIDTPITLKIRLCDDPPPRQPVHLSPLSTRTVHHFRGVLYGIVLLNNDTRMRWVTSESRLEAGMDTLVFREHATFPCDSNWSPRNDNRSCCICGIPPGVLGPSQTSPVVVMSISSQYQFDHPHSVDFYSFDSTIHSWSSKYPIASLEYVVGYIRMRVVGGRLFVLLCGEDKPERCGGWMWCPMRQTWIPVFLPRVWDDRDFIRVRKRALDVTFMFH